MTDRQRPPLPYGFLPEVPAFVLESDDVAEGEVLDARHRYDGGGLGGGNLSPELHWSGFPSATAGFAVTCFDPDAPTGSGFWHWVLFDLPAEVTRLRRGAGSGAPGALPPGAHEARNDMGTHGYVGAAPPEGHGPHRYCFAVHALDVATLGLGADAPPALVGFNLTFHTLARALLTPVYGR